MSQCPLPYRHLHTGITACTCWNDWLPDTLSLVTCFELQESNQLSPTWEHIWLAYRESHWRQAGLNNRNLHSPHGCFVLHWVTGYTSFHYSKWMDLCDVKLFLVCRISNNWETINVTQVSVFTYMFVHVYIIVKHGKLSETNYLLFRCTTEIASVASGNNISTGTKANIPQFWHQHT